MNKELIKELELLRFYKEKGCLDTHYKVLIDYIDELEQQNKELHNKIDKAIEYINDNVAVYAFNNEDLPHWEFNDDEIKILLEILKDSDIDEN